jgi:hypothetical protein
LLKETGDIGLPGQIKLSMAPRNDVHLTAPGQIPCDGASHHSAVPREINLRLSVHLENVRFVGQGAPRAQMSGVRQFAEP